MITITTFGYLHAPPPDAEVVIDLRRHYRDPHVAPELRYLTAHDRAVRAAVLGTPGIRELVAATADMAVAFTAGPSAADHRTRVAVGCAGGRHRAATVGIMLDAALRARGHDVTLIHRDLARPVVER
ncbi:ATPase [Embleya sp. NPDC056575]|uniref:RapZ C-terminal domain-containing protein n=1 Tax=unclassified Embleya TaxID=2699296 RepID=UPI0036B96327